MINMEIHTYTAIIPALRRQGQEDPEFLASLGYLAKSYLKLKVKTTTEKENNQGRGCFEADGLHDEGGWAGFG